MNNDKYRVYYGVDASHTNESKFFPTLRQAKELMVQIESTHYFTLYKYNQLDPVWDSMRQGDLKIARTKNAYRSKHNYPLMEEPTSRYSV